MAPLLISNLKLSPVNCSDGENAFSFLPPCDITNGDVIIGDVTGSRKVSAIIVPISCSVLHPVDYFRFCVTSKDELLGIVLGLAAVLVMLCAQVTLLLVRQRELTRLRRSSAFPLIHDFVADAFDCTGAILTKQSTFQVLFSLYMIGADILAAFQYVVYLFAKHCDRSRCDEEGVVNNHDKSKRSRKRQGRIRLRSVVIPGLATWILLLGSHYLYADTRLPHQSNPNAGAILQRDYQTPRHRSRLLLNWENHEDIIPVLGFTIAGIAVFLYWTRRVPILYAAFQERYIGRLRYAYHWQCILGNALYASTVFHQCHTMDDLLESLPWSLSRVGLVGMDLGLIFQIHLNDRARNMGKELKDDIVSILRNKYHRRTSSAKSQPEDDSQYQWVPLKPIKNRYLQKMSKIAKHIDNQLSDPDSDQSASGDEQRSLITETDANGALPEVFPPRQVTQADDDSSDTLSSSNTGELTDSESEIKHIWNRYRRNPGKFRENDITRILAAEDRRGSERTTTNGDLPFEELSFIQLNDDEITQILEAEDQRCRAPSSVCWSGTEDFFELNEDEITSILEAEDQYREGMPKIRRTSLQPFQPLPLRDDMAVNVRRFPED